MSRIQARAAARAAGVPLTDDTAVLHVAHDGPGAAWLAAHPELADDPTALGCCMGAAVYGPARCTCWTPVFDVPDAPPQPGEPGTMPRPCSDCAYRPDSPERADEFTADELLALPGRGTFWCHDGMARPVAYRHPQLGEVPADPADYQPLVVAGVPYRADGRPADRCAGWAARARKQPQATEEPR